MLNMSKPKPKNTIYDFFTRKRGPETETSSNKAAQNAVNRPSLSPEAEVITKDSEGDAQELQEQHSSYVQAKKRQKSAARPYKDDFLKFGFVNCSDAYHFAIPMCVICREKLANESLKPAKLERHLSSRHADLADKPLAFFQRKAQEIQSSAQVLSRSITHNHKLLLASYKVSYRIAKETAPHTIAERLILPAALDIVNTVLDEKASEKLKLIPLSDNTVSRRIGDIAQNLENQLIARLNSAKYFAIQLDESTDVSSSATLLVYVRYIWQGEFVEDLLCCLTLPSSTSGARIFEELNAFMTKCGLDWANCKGITSDGAANMTGKNSGVVRRIKDAAGQNIVWNHCFIHREALASKGMPSELEVVMKDIIKVVNFIKGSALNSRLFEALCEFSNSIQDAVLENIDNALNTQGNSHNKSLASEVQRLSNSTTSSTVARPGFEFSRILDRIRQCSSINL